MTKTTEIWDVIVIGGGAAGLSAAIMLGRSKRSVLIIDAGSPRNRFSNHMQGLIGSDGENPADFLAKARADLAQYPVELISETVNRVTETAGTFLVKTASAEYRARRLVAATGVIDQLPEIPGLAERWGKEVLHCPYCHGWEVRDQKLAVLATSLGSLHQLQLTRQLSDNLVFLTNSNFEVSPELEKRLAAQKIQLQTQKLDSVVIQNEKLAGVKFESGEFLDLDAIFVGATLIPIDSYLAELKLDRADSGFGSFIKVDPSGKTSNPKVWAVGNLSQATANVANAIAAGSNAGALINFDLIEEEFAGLLVTEHS